MENNADDYDYYLRDLSKQDMDYIEFATLEKEMQLWSGLEDDLLDYRNRNPYNIGIKYTVKFPSNKMQIIIGLN